MHPRAEAAYACMSPTRWWVVYPTQKGSLPPGWAYDTSMECLQFIFAACPYTYIHTYICTCMYIYIYIYIYIYNTSLLFLISSHSAEWSSTMALVPCSKESKIPKQLIFCQTLGKFVFFISLLWNQSQVTLKSVTRHFEICHKLLRNRSLGNLKFVISHFEIGHKFLWHQSKLLWNPSQTTVERVTNHFEIRHYLLRSRSFQVGTFKAVTLLWNW